MTRPIHSVNHIQASYRKYQLIALSSAILTVIAVSLATLSAVQLGNLGKQQAAAAQQNQLASAPMSEELKKLKTQIATLETRLSEENSIKEELEKKNKILQKKITEVQQALAAKAAAPPQAPALPLETTQQPSPKRIETAPMEAPQAESTQIAPPKPIVSSRGEDPNSSIHSITATNQSEDCKTPVGTATSITGTPILQHSTPSQPAAPEKNTPRQQTDSKSGPLDVEKPLTSPMSNPTESTRLQ